MTLAPVFLGSLGRRRMATLFSLVAIVLGVALGMAVQAIHEAALNEFGRGVRVLAGESDLRVIGPASGFDEALYEQILLHPEIAHATPIVEVKNVNSVGGGRLDIAVSRGVPAVTASLRWNAEYSDPPFFQYFFNQQEVTRKEFQDVLSSYNLEEIAVQTSRIRF